MRELLGLLGQGWVVAVLLLSTRVAAVLLFTPLLYAVAMPMLARVLLVVALSCALALPFARDAANLPADPLALAYAMVREAALGATLGLGILLAFAGFALAGRLLDVQVGFGIAQVLDPLTRSRVPVLSSLFTLLAAVFFFIVDGHHALLRGLAYSIERFPPGQGAPLAGAGDAIAREVAALFGLGFALAAPVVLALLLVEFALGVLARAMPQANVLLLGLPVKILAGLFALSVWIAGFGAPASRLYLQFASVGLLEALQRFDPERGAQFRTFAARRMQGAILDGLEHLSDKQQQIALRQRLRSERLKDLKQPAAGDAAAGLPPTPQQLLRFVSEVGIGLAVCWMLEGTALVEDAAAVDSVPFYRSQAIRQLRERLHGAIDSLPEHERAVVRGHYLQDLPFERIAAMLQLTKGRISQLHRQALVRLRAQVAEHADWNTTF